MRWERSVGKLDLTADSSAIIGGMNWNALPTPMVLASDLERVVHGLDRYQGLELLALRALPSVQLWQPSSSRPRLQTTSGIEVDALTQRGTSNLALRVRICEAIGRIPLTKESDALTALFSFENPKLGIGERQTSAAKALGISQNGVKKGREEKLLHTLADEMFRGELAWAISQFQPTGVPQGIYPVNPWFELQAFHRSVVIDKDAPHEQTWTTHNIGRAIMPAQPYLVTPVNWSGTGKEPGELSILSGPQDEADPFKHKLLDVRPESASLYAWNLYIWDLRSPVFAGDEVDLHWQQKLIDLGATFLPYVGVATDSYPALKKISLRAKVPATRAWGKQLINESGFAQSPYSSPIARSDGSPVVKLERDKEGYFTYEPQEILPGMTYELRWE